MFVQITKFNQHYTNRLFMMVLIKCYHLSIYYFLIDSIYPPWYSYNIYVDLIDNYSYGHLEIKLLLIIINYYFSAVQSAISS